MGISVILPAKKEAENLDILLPQIIEQVKKTGEKYEVIIIDGQIAEDNSKEICEKHCVEYRNQEEPYFLGAYRTGIKLARYDKMLVLDCDGSHPPYKIQELYKKYVEENCDVVIGSRYVHGGSSSSSFSQIFMSKLLNNTYRKFLGIDATDLSAGFKIYRTEILKKLTFTCKNFDLMEEMLVKMKLEKTNLKIGEVPIDFQDRMYGHSKRNPIVFTISFITTLFKLKYLILTNKK